MQEKGKARLFIAIDLPESFLKEAERIQKKLQKADLFEGRYTKREHMHITPKFIGEVEADQVEAIQTALQQIVLEPYQAQLGDVDVFVAGNKIKIIYLNVIVPGLVQLVQRLDEVLQSWCNKEERAFVSHITLARVKRVENNERLLGFLRRINVEPIQFTINTFALKESVLTPEGSEHKIIQEYPLK